MMDLNLCFLVFGFTVCNVRTKMHAKSDMNNFVAPFIVYKLHFHLVLVWCEIKTIHCLLDNDPSIPITYFDNNAIHLISFLFPFLFTCILGIT